VKPTALPSLCLAALFLVVGGAANPPALQAQVPKSIDLRWRLQSGKALQYTMKRDAVVTTFVQGQEMGFKEVMHIDALLEVDDTTAAGTVRVRQTLKRIRLRVELSQGQKFSYDSRKKSQHKDVPAKLTPVLDALVDEPLHCEVSRTGDVSGLELSPALEDALASYSKSVLDIGGIFSQPTLLQLAQEWFLPLPEEKAHRGLEWTSRGSYQFGPHIALVAGYKYVGLEQVNDEKLARIHMTAISPSKKENYRRKHQLTVKNSEGTALFDPLNGRLERFDWQFDVRAVAKTPRGPRKSRLQARIEVSSQ
jgi:hypothetical protein